MCLVVSLHCAQASAQETPHRYEVEVGADLSVLNIRARLAHRVRSVRSRHTNTSEFASNERTCEGQQLTRRGRQIDLPTGVRCIQYQYDMAAAAAKNPSRWVQLAAENRLVSPADWLFLPRLAGSTGVQVAFQVAPGHQVSAPWRPAVGHNTFLIERSPSSSDAQVAVGQFKYRELAVPGAILRVSLLSDSGPPMDSDKILTWLEQAARGVALAHGSFPNPNPQVLVVPARSSRSSPVPFGRVIRDGGEAVQFFADPERDLSDFQADWTATHEFAHLLLPYVRDRWVSEGFASYYQNVLMARGGNYSEALGWTKLHAGIERARAVSPRVSPADTTGGGRKPRMMVYWSGAAIALLGDIQQRQLSGGVESLEVVLGRLRACCLPSDRPWTAQQLFRKLDELSQHKVWMTLYHRYAATPGVPGLKSVYRQLGIKVARNGTVTLDDGAPQAALRQQLMGRVSHVTGD